MMLCWNIAAVLFLVWTGSEARTVQVRDEPDARCKTLYDFATATLADLKSRHNEVFQHIEIGVQMQVGTNVSNPEELKQFLCRLTGAKSLRTLYDNWSSRRLSYESVVRTYKRIQTDLIAAGGYTNAPRMFKAKKDIQAWVRTLPEGARNPPEATDLHSLTRFFEVMQVKYGSRWLSFIGSADNFTILTPDPKQTAVDLYESRSESDVMKILNTTMKKASPVYNILLLGRSQSYRTHDFELSELWGKAVVVVGDLGFFNLKY